MSGPALKTVGVQILFRSFSTWSAWRLLGAILTCTLLGWLLVHDIPGEKLEEMSPRARRAVIFSLRWPSPIAIAAVFIAALV